MTRTALRRHLPAGVLATLLLVGCSDGPIAPATEAELTPNFSSSVTPEVVITEPPEDAVFFDEEISLAGTTNVESRRFFWAVRAPGCATGTLAGNVDGFNSDYTYEENEDTGDWEFSSSVDAASIPVGTACFRISADGWQGSDAGRITVDRPFIIADARTRAGGQIVEGAVRDQKRATFGWEVFRTEIRDTNLGSDVLTPENYHPAAGSVDLNFKRGTSLGQANFTGSAVGIRFFDGSGGTGEVARMLVQGELDGDPGFLAVIRFEDADRWDSPAGYLDNIRIEIFTDAGDLVYDTRTEFTDESGNVGTARTFIFAGDISIEFRD